MKKIVMVFFVIVSLAITWFAYYYFFVTKNDNAALQARMQFDVFLLIDQSGSMKGDRYDPIPSDPEGIRVKAAHYFIDYMKFISDPKSNQRICLINFGSDTPAEYQVPLTEINIAGKSEEIKNKIQEYSLGYTNFYRALQKVKEFYDKDKITKEFRQPVIIIFTDGEPKDGRGLSKNQYFNEIDELVKKDFKNIKTEGVVRPVNFELFIIALDAKRAYWHKDRDQWEKLAPNKTFMLSKADEEGLETIFGKIVESLFSTQSGEWFDLETGTGKTILIPPYVEKVVISVKKDRKIKEQKLEISDPKGKQLEVGRKLKLSPGTGMNIYTLIEPDAGEWTLKLSPSGKVRVKQDFLPTSFQLKKPALIHPLGEPIEIVATFLKSDGTPVVPLPHYPFSFAISVKAPDGTKFQPKLHEDKSNKGVYRALESIPAKKEGVYEITFEVNVGAFLKSGNFTLSKNVITVEAKPIIYFKSIKPGKSSNYSVYHPIFFWERSDFAIEGRLYKEGKEIPMKELSDDNANGVILAQIEKEKRKEVSNVQFLKYDEKKKSFLGTLSPEKTIFPGVYALTTKMDMMLKDGTRYTREDENEFNAVIGYGLFGWGIFFLLIFYLSLQISWRFIRGPLRGQISVGIFTAKPRDILFYNKCRMVSRRKKLILPWINTIRHDADKTARLTCPTFYVIGDKHKMKDGRTEPAVTVFYRKFHFIPWWKKLYRGNSVSINGFTIKWINL